MTEPTDEMVQVACAAYFRAGGGAVAPSAMRPALAAASALAWRRLDEFPDKTKWPWDGGHILGCSDEWDDDCAPQIIHWHKIMDCWVIAWDHTKLDGSNSWAVPTHFRPLPAPPQERP